MQDPVFGPPDRFWPIGGGDTGPGGSRRMGLSLNVG